MFSRRHYHYITDQGQWQITPWLDDHDQPEVNEEGQITLFIRRKAGPGDGYSAEYKFIDELETNKEGLDAIDAATDRIDQIEAEELEPCFIAEFAKDHRLEMEFARDLLEAIKAELFAGKIEELRELAAFDLGWILERRLITPSTGAWAWEDLVDLASEVALSSTGPEASEEEDRRTSEILQLVAKGQAEDAVKEYLSEREISVRESRDGLIAIYTGQL